MFFIHTFIKGVINLRGMGGGQKMTFLKSTSVKKECAIFKKTPKAVKNVGTLSNSWFDYKDKLMLKW